MLTLSRPSTWDAEAAENLGKLGNSELFADVIIHCRGQVRFRSSKMILSQFSNFLKETFDPGNQNTDFAVLICPDIDPEAMKATLHLIHRGQAFVTSAKVYKSMRKIMSTLRIDLDLTEFRTVGRPSKPSRRDNQPDMNDVSGGTDQDKASYEDVIETSNGDNSSEFVCKFCKRSLPSLQILHSHVVECRKLSLDDVFSNSPKKPSLESKQKAKHGEVVKQQQERGSSPECNKKRVAEDGEAMPSGTEFSCVTCGQKFTFYFALMKHINSRHRNLADDVSGDKIGQIKIEPEIFEFLPMEKEDKVVVGHMEDDGDVAASDSLSFHDLVNATIADGESQFVCKLCSLVFISKGNLCNHICRMHYRSEILAANNNDKSCCNICSNYKGHSLFYHVGIGHGVLKKILSGEVPENTTTYDPLDDSQNSAANSSAVSFTYKELLKPANENGKFECKICSAKSSSLSNLRKHICKSHFMSQILEANGNNEKSCHSCGKSSVQVTSLLNHIGLKHRVLEKILSQGDVKRMFMTSKPSKRGRKARKQIQ